MSTVTPCLHLNLLMPMATREKFKFKSLNRKLISCSFVKATVIGWSAYAGLAIGVRIFNPPAMARYRTKNDQLILLRGVKVASGDKRGDGDGSNVLLNRYTVWVQSYKKMIIVGLYTKRVFNLLQRTWDTDAGSVKNEM